MLVSRREEEKKGLIRAVLFLFFFLFPLSFWGCLTGSICGLVIRTAGYEKDKNRCFLQVCTDISAMGLFCFSLSFFFFLLLLFEEDDKICKWRKKKVGREDKKWKHGGKVIRKKKDGEAGKQRAYQLFSRAKGKTRLNSDPIICSTSTYKNGLFLLFFSFF